MYDGTKFYGSQIQPNKITVESTLLNAFKKINITTKLIFSGRTDKDVHATSQIINCIVPDYWHDLEKLKNILNHTLCSSIKIRYIKQVSDDFHARYSAKKRTYRYIITTQPTNPFNNAYITYHKNINFELIQDAIKEFIGIHDFEYFSKSDGGNHTSIRQIYFTKFYRYKEFYIFTFTANGFLRSQIRLMIEFLLKISDKKLTKKQLIEQLNKHHRYNFKPACANGLYLSKVTY
jgi:tRNA pseudouridine38-40 synthase